MEYVLLGHISKKIANLLIIIHISSSAMLVERRSKHIARTPFEATYRTLSEKETKLQPRKTTQRQVQPPKCDPYPCTIFCRMPPGQISASKNHRNKDAGLLSLRAQIRGKRPNYRISVVKCRVDLGTLPLSQCARAYIDSMPTPICMGPVRSLWRSGR